MIFVGFLFIYAISGFLITLKPSLDLIHTLGINASSIALNCLALITIAIPPALPNSLHFSIWIALYRLKKKKIFCINPLKINLAGRISVMCFDKTGTLTEDCLDLYKVLAIGFNISKNVVDFKIMKNAEDCFISN